MSDVDQATPHTPACEQLLDYVYDMLDEPQKAAFEQHLATCARCQAEAASFGKVRQATAKLMPAVEPPATLTGALHAQLMHAAAQRQPSRGKLLSFPRRVMQHPAWAAAAMFVIVGSAITLNAVRGKLMMPTRSAPAVASAPVVRPEPEAVPVASPGVAAPAGPGGAVTAEASSPVAKAAPAEMKMAKREVAGAASLGRDGKPADAPMESAKRRAAAPARAAAPYKQEESDDLAIGGLGKGSLNLDKAAPSKAGIDRGGGGGVVAAKPQARSRDEANLSSADAVEGGSAGKASGGVVGGGLAKSSAPSSVARMSKEEERSLNAVADQQPASAPAPATAAPRAESAAPYASGALAQQPEPEAHSARHHASATQRPPAPATASASPPMVSAPPRAQVQSSYGYGNALPAPTVVAQQQQQQVDLHQRADDLVRASRCDEAVKVYAELDRRSQRLSPKERANYVRCLTATGRQQAAEQQLDELKADKSVTNGLVQQAEGDVQNGRRGVSEKPDQRAEKKAKKSPAADRDSQRRPRPSDAAPTEPLPAL